MKHRFFGRTILFLMMILLVVNVENINSKVVTIHLIDEVVATTSTVKEYQPMFLCGSLDTQTETLIKWDIDNVASYQPDGMNLVLRTQYDPDTNTFSTSQSLESFYQTYEYALSLGIQTRMVRISASRYNFTYLNESIMDEWMQFYLPLLQEIVNMFKDKNIQYFCVMNETNACYCNSKYDDFTLKCIKIAKDAGFEVGISFSGTEEIYDVSDRVCDKLDFVGVNIYPKIGYEGNYTDYQKWIDIMKDYKNQIDSIVMNKGKGVFITEIGIPDSWECQTKLTYYNKGTLSYGVLPATFWTAFFESGLGDNCIGTSMWFWECSREYDNVKDVIKGYRGKK